MIYKMEFGSHELKHFTRIEEGKIVYYGFCIDRDKNGKILSKSEPKRIMEMWVD